MNVPLKREQINSRLTELAQAFNEAQSIVARTRAEMAFFQGQLALLDELEVKELNGTPDQANSDNR